MSNYNKTTVNILDELISLHDQDFVQSAYQILLDRAPDPEGLHYYLARIRKGISKEEIVAQLGQSSECKSRKVKIAGLNKLIKHHRRLKTPFLGMFLRLLGPKKVERDIQQKLRVIENKLYAQNVQVQKRFSEMSEALDQLKKLAKIKERPSVEQNKATQLSNFDADWYQEQYPDIVESRMDPYEHYMAHGKKEGRHPAFDSTWYLAQYPDIAENGINPFDHYMTHGKKEGRHPAFDSNWYLTQYPDVIESGMTPIEHYISYGKSDGRYPAFDREGYLIRYPDVASSGIDPLDHYIQHGKSEGRFPAYNPADKNNYPKWIHDFEMLTKEMREAMHNQSKGFMYRPLISVVMPVYNPNPVWFAEAIESVRNQIYPNWELCIADDASPDTAIRPILEHYLKLDKRIKVEFRHKNGHISAASNSALAIANGDWVALLDHDDILPEYALFWIVDAINKNPDIRMIYSDEDKIDEQGNRFAPYFKCDWNPDLFYSHNMFSHLGVYQMQLVREVTGFSIGMEGSQDYDLALRCIEHIASEQIHHIPRVLYHWRLHAESTASSPDAKPYAMIAGERAINNHLKRQGINAKAELIVYGYRVRYALPDILPLVSLIIPTRNGLQLIQQCIESIVQKTMYSNYEILIVDNGSDELATLQYLKEVVSDIRIRVIRDDSPFNYSALNNAAVKLARGEVIGLINNDIEVISPDWLTEMVSHALRPEVGAVGAKLLYPNDTVQHAGVLLGVTDIAAHAHKNLPKESPGYFGRASLIQSFSAVTAACLVVRKTIYESVGGLNEVDLAIAFNDIDFCIRVRKAGYRNIFTPYAELYHHESATRCLDDLSDKRFSKEVDYMKRNLLLTPDPAYSPNLTLEDDDFSLAWPPRVENITLSTH